MSDHKPISCEACLDGADLGFDFKMAFQPIIRVSDQSTYAQEALCRGPEGQGARYVLDQVTDENLYRFDQAARVKAIETASRVGIDTGLSINFLPNAVYRPETCIRATLEAASRFQFEKRRLIFEVSETERISDPEHLLGILQEYRTQGFRTALDDFGAGYSGLRLLTRFQPDIVKMDRSLISDIHLQPTKQKIMRNLVSMSIDLGMMIVAEGVERREEAEFLMDLGIDLFQGYLFARPSLESQPPVDWSWLGQS